jgi:phosphoglucomutase
MDLKLKEALDKMILTASGWRSIFSADGNGESCRKDILPAHKIIVAAAAKVFSDSLSGIDGVILVGRDTRPTGEAIADAVIRSILLEGRELKYAGIAAAPEIMALARKSKTAGFVYISASHNPIGNNGIKFGLSDGGVLKADKNALLVSALKTFLVNDALTEGILSLLESVSAEKLAGVYTAQDENKKAALTAYRDFTEEVITGSEAPSERKNIFHILREAIEKRPLGIAADFNGSARTVSIDRDFFSALGCNFSSINGKPGEIAHNIIPEGNSLIPCREFLESMRKQDTSFILGYMPDCDGDRGNLAVWDESSGGARILRAQEVFALACVAELSYLVWKDELKYDSSGKALNKAALAVNDPTSLRIDRIAKIFDASVFRAEVGEANVVALAGILREKGCLVRTLGEGSSGGTIIHPSTVRDPIDTLGAIIKLLSIKSGEKKGLFEIWCELSNRKLSNQKSLYREDFTLADIISSLPAFVTTETVSSDALLNVKTLDHGLLKGRYQKIFIQEWEEKKSFLMETYGISSWEAIAYNGTEEKRGISSFSDAGRGGLKIEFSNLTGEKVAFIWMRGSGTEPVFRIMADAEGQDNSLERTLIEWQRQMVLKADRLVSD